MEVNETELIQQAQKGDAHAFEKLVKNHEQKIYNLLIRMTGNPTETADLFQETFLNAWKNIQRFRSQSNFSTWLYRIAMNAVLMKRRKKKIPTVPMDAPLKTEESELKREFAEDWSKSPQATLENKELREKLNHAIELLPEKYKAVLVLSDIQGLSHEEIRKVLGISIPSVKTRLHRARAFLQKELSGYFKKHD